MQDNARIHTARMVKKWFEDNAIPVIEWPPYSPDLNPIEHCWRHIKEWVHEHYPELIEMKGDVEEIKKRMIEALQDAWAHINDEFLMALIASMTARCEAVIKAEGWYTRY